jgi:hypothetical protein
VPTSRVCHDEIISSAIRDHRPAVNDCTESPEPAQVKTHGRTRGPRRCRSL